jgi:alanine dehydrogenase
MLGVDIATVSQLLGHKSIQITMRYAHLAPEHQLEAVQRLCETKITQKGATDIQTDTEPLSCLEGCSAVMEQVACFGRVAQNVGL